MTEAPPIRRLGAVGTLVWDTNWHPSVLAGSGAPLEQWGGAVYSLSSLAATCPRGWIVQPILKVGADLAARAIDRLSTLPNLDLDPGIRSVPEPNNRVELLYQDLAHRTERLTGGVPGWTYEELEPLLPRIDALYLNFIAGSELGLADTLRLRANFPGLVYGDLHSLFLGPPGAAARPPRPLERADEWLTCFDIVQLNEAELELLSAGRDWETMLGCFAEAGVKLVVATLGERGVRYGVRAGLPEDPLAWRSAAPSDAVFESGVLPTPLGELPGDPTGCGDVWGAAFLAGLLARLPLRNAIMHAERLAAAKMDVADTATLYERLAAAAPDHPLD